MLVLYKENKWQYFLHRAYNFALTEGGMVFILELLGGIVSYQVTSVITFQFLENYVNKVIKRKTKCTNKILIKETTC